MFFKLSSSTTAFHVLFGMCCLDFYRKARCVLVRNKKGGGTKHKKRAVGQVALSLVLVMFVIFLFN